MRSGFVFALVGVVILFSVIGCNDQQAVYKWGVHDLNRPVPEVITAGKTDDAPPSDAIVLFDGSDLSKWEPASRKGKMWIVEDGCMLPVEKAGYIRTKEGFGSCQLHIEWATPSRVTGEGQGRGNSGVFLMGFYEVQILDSYDNTTYADGQVAALYGQKPPIVNVSRGPGQWQSYDIIFHRPCFDEKDRLTKPATITVLQNGVLVQDNWIIKGKTWHKKRSVYESHADKLPLKLQDHGNPVRFRNIWIRELSAGQ